MGSFVITCVVLVKHHDTVCSLCIGITQFVGQRPCDIILITAYGLHHSRPHCAALGVVFTGFDCDVVRVSVFHVCLPPFKFSSSCLHFPLYAHFPKCQHLFLAKNFPILYIYNTKTRRFFALYCPVMRLF